MVHDSDIELLELKRQELALRYGLSLRASDAMRGEMARRLQAVLRRRGELELQRMQRRCPSGL